MEIADLYKLYLQHPVITTDSRDCPKGSIFFALKGESFNGNKFAAAALKQGCAFVVVDEPDVVPENDTRYILVDDVLTTFQQLAREHRRALGTKIIGITGTNGKTTTKELVAAVLSERFNTLYTQGNFNNDVGVPKTLFRLTKEHEIAVVEMGASHPGDIKRLVETVEPDCGIITNVGKAHLQGFGSFEGVVRTKGELYDFLRQKGGATVFIDADNPHLLNISNDLSLIKYGTNADDPNLTVCGRLGVCAPFLSFDWRHGNGEYHHVNTHLIGTYNLQNMLAAATIGLFFGISEQQICHALSNYIPSNNRSQLDITQHNKLIIDAYNANPTSMAAAIRNFKTMQVAPKMAILGDMKELGDTSKEEHQRIADSLIDAHFDTVWLVGDEFCRTNSPFRKFKNVEEVKEELMKSQPQNQFILIKGSNSVKLFQLPEML